jgi:transposase
MAKATEYVLKRWKAFTRYANDPRLPIDNNPAERAIRAVSIGRKNWLFLGSENGGKTAATLMSLIGSAHHLGINAWVFLKDVLERIPRTPTEQLESLLPDVWQREQAENVTGRRGRRTLTFQLSHFRFTLKGNH